MATKASGRPSGVCGTSSADRQVPSMCLVGAGPASAGCCAGRTLRMRALMLGRLMDLRLEAGCFMLADEATRNDDDRRVTLESPASGEMLTCGRSSRRQSPPAHLASAAQSHAPSHCIVGW